MRFGPIDLAEGAIPVVPREMMLAMDRATPRSRSGWRAAFAWLPKGASLEASVWATRHRGICILLWLHAVVLVVAALLLGYPVVHSCVEGGFVAWLALGATLEVFGTRIRSALATLGLMSCSALVVHLADGLIEAHFHFFVVVAVVALYQSWQPYLLALAYVVVHHSLMGALTPHGVYNHPAATENPLLWGLIHGGFILAESAACLIYWRASEQAVGRERAARWDAELAHRELAEAQSLSAVGSWEWDHTTGAVTWSEQLYRLTGVDPMGFIPSLAAYLDLVHPEDRARVAALVQDACASGAVLDYECRLLRPDGSDLMIHARGESTTDLRLGRAGMRGTVQDVTQLKQLEQAIVQMAFEDPLTGLANRRVFTDRLEKLASRSPNLEKPCAVVFIDLDDFKEVNDAYGHAVGDAVLQDVASRIEHCVGPSATVARIGGDEFAVIYETADPHLVEATAEHIEAELDYDAEMHGHAVRVSASIGLATADSRSSIQSLLRRADEAMYAAKHSQRASSSTRSETITSTALNASP